MDFLANKIIQSLQQNGIIENIDNADKFSWEMSPHFDEYHCYLYASEVKNKNNISNDIIKEISFFNNYINIKLNPNFIINNLKTVLRNSLSYKNKNVVVEHTSLTPVYPLNMATFRSSVIGNALSITYKMYGAKVKTHYIVSDNSRNVDLIAQNYSYEDISKSNQPKDRVIGNLFIKSLKQIKDKQNLNENLFNVNEDIPNNFNCYNDINKKQISKMCCDSVIRTLDSAGIKIDCLDYESDFIDLTHENNKYYYMNVNFFNKYAKTNDLVVSVVNKDQEIVVNSAKDGLENVKSVFYENILWKTDTDYDKDSIFNNRFNMVEEFVDNVCKNLTCSKSFAYDCVKFLFLSYKHSEKIKLDNSLDIKIQQVASFLVNITNLKKIKTYIGYADSDILLALELIKINTKCLEITKDDYYMKTIIFIKKLIENAINFNSMNENVKYVLVQTVKTFLNQMGINLEGGDNV